MAEPTAPPPASAAAVAPILSSTADTVPYVPVSWLAAGAMGLSALFVLTLLIMGYSAFREKRPLLMEGLLLAPLVAIVLSFAARRIIRNSEGTRTGTVYGIDLPTAAWWSSLVVGLGYLAYLLAVDFAIRRDAEGEVARWGELILESRVADPPDKPMTVAFFRTRDPSQRARIRSDDAATLENRWRNDFVTLRQSDLARLARRNAGRCELIVGGLRDWNYRPTGIDCLCAATVRCPEGTFPMQIPIRAVEPARGSEVSGGRQWQVIMTPSGFMQRDQFRVTPYGWYLAHMEASGVEYGRRFIAAASAGRPHRLLAYLEFAPPDDDPLFRPLTAMAFPAHAALGGNAAAIGWAIAPTLLDRSAERLFRLPGGAVPPKDLMDLLKSDWSTVGLVRAGERLRENTDTFDEMTFSASTIELRVPIEIPLGMSRGDISVAKGRLILGCTTPGVLAEANRLRDEANPDAGTTMPSDDILKRSFEWKLLRIETDRTEIKMRQREAPGGPGGPPPEG